MTDQPAVLTIFETALMQLHMEAMMNYGSVLNALKGDDANTKAAFHILMRFAVNVMGQTICSLQPIENTLNDTHEHMPKMLEASVEVHKKIMAEALSFLERDGAPLQ